MEESHQVVEDGLFSPLGSQGLHAGGVTSNLEVRQGLNIGPLEVGIEVLSYLQTLVEYPDTSLTILSSIEHGKLDIGK